MSETIMTWELVKDVTGLDPSQLQPGDEFVVPVATGDHRYRIIERDEWRMVYRIVRVCTKP